MKLIRYEPTRTTSTDLDRLFGAFPAFPAFSRLGGVFDSLLGDAAWTGSPAADLYEDKDHYHVRVELPGVKKDDIQVELVDDVLTVTAKRAAKSAEGETTAEFARTVSVPAGVDPAKIAAAYENGVLSVTLPKPEARKPRRIAVA